MGFWRRSGFETMNTLIWFKRNALWDDRIARLSERQPHLSITFTTDVSDSAIATADAIIGTKVPETVLRAATNLRFLGVSVAGVDHLPMALLKERNVVVASAHANGRYVAERALAMILAFKGKIVQQHQDLSRGIWHGFAAGESPATTWHSLFEANVTILGTGSIGTALAKLLKPFNCNITGFRRTKGSPVSPLFNTITTDLTTAVTGADVVVCTLPLTEATRGLVDGTVLQAMAGASLVNVGRGAVIEEDALYRALEDGTLQGAAIDTWYTYPEDTSSPMFPGNRPFHNLPNVLLSPHMGGYASRPVADSLDDIIAQYEEFLRGESLRGAVDLREQY